MSEKVNNGEVKTVKPICYRNINKDPYIPAPVEEITKNFHLEQVENNEVVIVEDRADDWQEIHNRDADKVGLAAVLDIARRQGIDPFNGQYAFQDQEALDLGNLDAKDPESVNQVLTGGKAATAKLEQIAQQLGVSVDVLVDATIKGTIAELINQQTAETQKGENE